MKVAVTGANGFVGTALQEALAASTWEVLPLVRSAQGLSNELITGDLARSEKLAIGTVDAFVHLAAHTGALTSEATNFDDSVRQSNVDATINVLKVAKQAGARHFIYLSSLKAMGEITGFGAPFTESTVPQPQDVYGHSKLEAEKIVERTCQQLGMTWTIIRPPIVYGERSGPNFQALAKLARSGLPLPLASVHNRRSLIYVANLADFIKFALDNASVHNATFIVTDGKAISIGVLLQKMALAMQTRMRLFSFPVSILESALKVTGQKHIAQRLLGSLEASPDAAFAAGWKPPFTLDEGLTRTLSSA